jgi:hypothetical protein
MKCEWLKDCFFSNGIDSAAINALKAVYCHGNPTLCARRHVALAVGKDNVPMDMTPNHQHRVQNIIAHVLNND